MTTGAIMRHTRITSEAPGEQQPGASFPTDSDALLTESQAAGFLNLSIRTLQAWRVRGGGPAYVKCGRAVRYRRCALVAYVEARTFAHTADSGHADGSSL